MSVKLFLRLVAGLLGTFLSGGVYAQHVEEKSNGICISGSVHYGFVMPHTEKIKHLVQSHLTAYEIDVYKKTLGIKPWQQIYGRSALGIKMFYASLGNPKQLGNVIGVLPYIDFPLKWDKHIYTGIHLGAGLGYLTKHFDRLENYKNNAIGSGLNGTMHGSFQLRWQVLNKVDIHASLSLTHFSNGAYKVPNLGINIPTISMGVAYTPNAYSPQSGSTDTSFLLPPVNTKIKYDLTISIAGKEILPAGGNKYISYILSSDMLKPLGHKGRLMVGGDLFYETSLLEEFHRDSITLAHNYKIARFGIHAGYELVIGKLSVLGQTGVYLLYKWKEDGPVYHRMGLRYHLTNKFIINMTLKTHFLVADYSEWGIGWKF